MKNSILTLAIIACFALLLTACSGGGGGSNFNQRSGTGINY